MRQRKLAIGTILGLVVAGLLLMLPAGAVDTGTDLAWSEPMNHEIYWEAYFGGECTKYENHSGSIPAGYEAVVVHDGQWVRVYYPVSGAFTALGPFNYNTQNPDDHFAGPHSWVMKCDIETTEETTSTVTEETTTIPEVTTTTLPEVTTTEPSTTTTISSTTTTDNGSILALWSASATCSSVTAEWGEGISRVDVASLDTVPGTGEVVGDLDSPFLTPGTKTVKVGTPTVFRLTPVVGEGYEADFIDVTVGVCDPTTTAPTGSTLPFTGYSRMTILTMIFVAAISGIAGFVMVMGGREE